MSETKLPDATNMHPDIGTVLMRLVCRFTEDDPDYARKPVDFQTYANLQIFQTLLSTLNSEAERHLQEYDSVSWEEDIIDAAFQVGIGDQLNSGL